MTANNLMIGLLVGFVVFSVAGLMIAESRRNRSYKDFVSRKKKRTGGEQ